MIIPLNEIAPETLQNLVEAFVLQEGTDYGEMEYDLEQKVNHVMMQLKSGQAFVQYSELHESVNIVSKDQIET
ncbi:YheU family protein [Aliiglaciecola sp. 3_MG-2023]|uniref:YheU family protein n=1 Tax=Aliiglaciecola sp. 3_MG-2023 TaxID=3062644 RepID=UPI0026E16284|nr:YheU family protein [Aliiglaciecola sp. 3_MG-2023]MDO6694380.1 YheU family protein [Aliiglaciecola sp. 3_MG-2023]